MEGRANGRLLVFRFIVWDILFLQDSVGLQHPEGVHPPPGAQTERRSHRAFPAHPGPEVQLRQDDLQAVLRQAPPQGHQLQEEVLWSQPQPETQEEAEVITDIASPLS